MKSESGAGNYWLPTRAGERASLTAISGPLIAAYLVEMAMLIIDMIIVGHLGSIELAAVGLAGDWFYVLLLIGMGTVSMVAVLVAQARGRGDRQAAGQVVEQGLLVATVFSLPVMIATWSLAPLLGLAGQDPRVVAAVAPYTHALTFAVLPILWFTVLRNYVTAVEKPMVIFVLSVAALILNAGLNYTLVFGHFGLPALGVFGAGLGTTIVSWLMFVALAVHVGGRHGLRIRWSRAIAIGPPDRPLAGKLVSLGLPVAGAQLLSGGMFTVAAVLVGLLGAVQLAAQQIVYTVVYISLSIAAGLGDAVRVRVAFGTGKGSPPAARQAAAITLRMGLAVLGLAAVVLWFFPAAIVGLFLGPAQPDALAVREAAASFAFAAGLFQLLLGLGSGTVACFAFGLGGVGLWWGMTGGVAVSSTLMTLAFFRKASGMQPVAVI